MVVDGGVQHDVLELQDFSDHLIRVRTAFLFEVGEELSVRIEHGGDASDVTARVRAHSGPADARITELEISDRSAPRRAEG